MVVHAIHHGGESHHVEAEAWGPPEQKKKTTERQEVKTQSNTEPLGLFSFHVSGQKIQMNFTTRRL